MHGRMRDLPRMRLRQKRHVIIFVLSLVGNLLCSGLTAEAKSDYEIINTGIKGGGCWYDDNHFIVVKGQQPAPGQEFEVEGLYYIDPSQSKDLKRIDLAPIDPNQQRRIRDVTCQDQTILFHVLTTDKKRNVIYSLKIGRPPAVLVEKTEGFVLPQTVSVKNQYVLGFVGIIGKGRESHSATAEQAMKDCHFANLMDGYRVFCLRHDRSTKQTWLANNTFLTKYLWDETIRVGEEGIYKRVPNPEPPLKLPDGTELKQGYLLRDLENRILQEIPTKQSNYKMDAISIKPNPEGTYLYARCSKAVDYNPPKTFYGRICRFNLGGEERQWEEVFSIQKEPNEPSSLYDFDVNDSGDVVVMRRAKHARPTLWKYSAPRANVEQFPTGPLNQEVGALRLAPDGRTMSYATNEQLVFVQPKGEK